LHLEFTHIFTTNFVVSLDIRASRKVSPIGVRSPKIHNPTTEKIKSTANKRQRPPIGSAFFIWSKIFATKALRLEVKLKPRLNGSRFRVPGSEVVTYIY
jgi:hypothetical protein